LWQHHKALGQAGRTRGVTALGQSERTLSRRLADEGNSVLFILMERAEAPPAAA
jgi:hypothetical protein